jgi:transaldolase
MTSRAPASGGDCEAVLTRFAAAGVNVATLGAKLQTQGAEAFVKSWSDLMAVISKKSAALESRGAEVNR